MNKKIIAAVAILGVLIVVPLALASLTPGMKILPVPINNTPNVTVLFPNGGEILSGDINILWTATDPQGDPLKINISYWKVGENLPGVLITEGTENDGEYLWDTTGQCGSYWIVVTASDGQFSGGDWSDGPFEITTSCTTPVTQAPAVSSVTPKVVQYIQPAPIVVPIAGIAKVAVLSTKSVSDVYPNTANFGQTTDFYVDAVNIPNGFRKCELIWKVDPVTGGAATQFPMERISGTPQSGTWKVTVDGTHLNTTGIIYAQGMCFDAKILEHPPGTTYGPVTPITIK